MAKIKRITYDSDQESPAQASTAPPAVKHKDKAIATRTGASAEPVVKHGVGKGLMVQPGKKTAFEPRAREEKRNEEERKKKEEEKKNKRKIGEIGGASNEPRQKKNQADEVAALHDSVAETAIVPAVEQSALVVNVGDSPEPVSELYDFAFQFKGAGKHIAEVPQQCSAFVKAVHGKSDLEAAGGSGVAEGGGYDHHADFSTSIVRVLANYNQLTLSHDRAFIKALDYELELKQLGSLLVQLEKERTKLEEKLEQQKAFLAEANQMAERGREESRVWKEQADHIRCARRPIWLSVSTDSGCVE